MKRVKLSSRVELISLTGLAKKILINFMLLD